MSGISYQRVAQLLAYHDITSTDTTRHIDRNQHIPFIMIELTLFMYANIFKYELTLELKC